MSIFLILIIIALLLTIASFIWKQYPLLQVAVLLVCIALLSGHVNR